RTLASDEWADVSPGEVVDLGAVMLILTRGDDQADADAAPPKVAGAIERAERLLDRIAPGEISVLIQGETGVGKEVFAERLHAKSRRAAAPLLRLNCGGFTESLLDSELFGHEKGAFTGADRAKPGLLENADGGSVFLDEIGELPMGLQVRLLRVLQDRKVQRVGALAPRAIDVRFISATNRDLATDVAVGRFRQDLYYRLNGVTLWIPPLRERVAEIAPLAQRFLAAANPTLRLSAAAIARIERHAWPGNIRELKNVIERAALICRGDEVGVAHLQLADAGPTTASGGSLSADVEAVEKHRILEVLARCGGNQTRAAQELGIARNTLVARMKQFGIKRPRS